ncbi:uncharacterized protein At2g39910 [Mercurialis annua]|uniref:uncharacterized protein At2g39910 n=1 Tax=Mercurialis annua TaxID=3986 RepID=UPI00215EC578|nr:uncharacterized protein At2g39910 [Mercurialis annua]
MSNSLIFLHSQLIQFSNTILTALSKANYTQPAGTNISTKSILESLLTNQILKPNQELNETQLHNSIKNFTLATALLSSSELSTHELLNWVPDDLSFLANSVFYEFSRVYCRSEIGGRNEKRVSEVLGFECGEVSEEKRLVVELIHEILPVLKERIQESSIDKGDDGDEISAASARAPVGFAVLAAYQFRWFVTQVDYPYLGKMCNLVIPCGLTALDHWSSEVKGQGMISFVHLARNVHATELSWYEDVILDACCQNIASADEIWHHVVEMSVIIVTHIHRSNPRSPWFERMLSEMLSHLERQPRNKDRRTEWLKFIGPLFDAVGLVLLAHFRRIFPLFFQWLHADDDETVLLVLKQIQKVIRLTWIRNTAYVERLVDELVVLYKEAALKTARGEIRTSVHEILILLKQCKGVQFKSAWDKYCDDPNLMILSSSLSGTTMYEGTVQAEVSHSCCIQEG